MDEIARIADRATILRDGRHVITAPLSELPIETMIEHIVGKRSRGLSDVRREAHAIGDTLLELRNVSGEHIPRNVDLTVHRGEVVGIAGLLGSGRSSLARTMCGMSRMVEGEIRIAGKPVAITRPKDAIEAGLVLIPEDRIRQGVIAEHSVAFNTSLAVLDRLSGSGGFVNADEVRALTDRQIARLKIKTASRDHAVRTLSGGNQQKVVIAKWLSAEPEILVLDEPTSGIDIGSKSEILMLVRELAKAGKAVIMISSELSEILSACDRIVVMSDGRVMEDLPRAALDDPSAPADDPVAQLQAAERNLQIAIQRALTASQSLAPGGTHVH
jgi:ribose transport system ATP-binding protein